MRQGLLESAAASEEDTVYRLYYDFRQPVGKLHGHQILAINRGERERLSEGHVELDRGAAPRRCAGGGGARRAAMEFDARCGGGRL